MYLILANEILHALHPNIVTIAEDVSFESKVLPVKWTIRVSIESQLVGFFPFKWKLQNIW